MKKLCILSIMFCLLLAGCGNVVKTGISKTTNTTDNTKKVLAEEIEQLEEDKVDAVLMEQYPEWFDEDGNIVYPYTPYQPKKWKKACKKGDMHEKLRIPTELVDALSTKRLLKAVEDYPFWWIDFYNSTDDAVYFLSHMFYGMEALLAREDYGRVAFESYCSRDIKPTKKYNDRKNSMKDRDLLKQLMLEEYLIAQEATYEALTEEERNLMIKTYRKSKKKKMKLRRYKEHQVLWICQYSFEASISEDDNPWNVLLNSKAD